MNVNISALHFKADQKLEVFITEKVELLNSKMVTVPRTKQWKLELKFVVMMQ